MSAKVRPPTDPAVSSVETGGSEQSRRRRYSRPVLERLGSLSDVTLAGTSPGIGDSQYPNTRP